MRFHQTLVKRNLLFAAIFLLLNYFGVFLKVAELHYEYFYDYSSRPLQRRYKTNNSAQTTKAAFINLYNYEIKHDVYNKCQQKPDSAAILTLLIKSANTNVQRRNVIRKTWGAEKPYLSWSVRRVFLLGISRDSNINNLIDHESSRHGDILQSNFIDDYFNNTIKTVLGMRWAVEHCANNKLFMFVDDDYYVSIKNLEKFVQQPIDYPPNRATAEAAVVSDAAGNSNLYAGYVMQTAPHRHKFSKWYVSLEEYPFNSWPPYVTAGAFVLTKEYLFKLYYASLNTLHFRFDDIFLGIAAQGANITLTHCKMFHFNKPVYTGVKSYKNVIASHGFDVDLEFVWTQSYYAGYA